MKKSSLLAVAAALALSTGAYAAEVDFDKGIDDVLDIVNTLGPQQYSGIPQPGHFQPVNNGGHNDNHPGNFDNHPGNIGNHPGNFDNHPGNIDNHPGNIGNHPGNFDNHPGNIDNHPGHIDNHPGNHDGWDNHPGNIDNHPGNHDGWDNHPGNIDNHPGNHDGWDNHPGNHDGWDNHPGNHDGWDSHDGYPYSPVYPELNCRTWEFSAQTPNTRTEELSGEEPSFDCYMNNGVQYCRHTGRYFTRKITVNIGPRALETWEKENLKVCLDPGNSPRVDTSDMLYQYTVNSQDHDGFFFGHATVFDLTPGLKKPSNPDSKELSVNSVGVTAAGDVRLVLNDNRAMYFKGEKIDISVSGMNIPDMTQLTPEGIANSFVEINAQGSFDVAPSYDIKLMNAPKPGKYMITIKFTRRGPLSTGAEASTIESFDLK